MSVRLQLIRVLAFVQVVLILPIVGLCAVLEAEGIFFAVGTFLALILAALELSPDGRPSPGKGTPLTSLEWRWTLAMGIGMPLFAVLRTQEPHAVAVAFLLVSLPLGALQWHEASHPSARVAPVKALPARAKRKSRSSESTSPPSHATVQRGPFDFLLVIWMANIVLGTFTGWMLTSMITLSVDNYRLWSGVRAFLCVALPIVCVLPGFWHLKSPHIMRGAMVLVIGTAFQVATGVGAARAFVQGPRSEEVVVEELQYRQMRSKSHRFAIRHVVLADGRRFKLPTEMRLDRGQWRLTVLPGLDRILAAERL